tara:strand:- start:467 stop:652 length:186 start_codon:yes stop_codon:yes gene_type:complete
MQLICPTMDQGNAKEYLIPLLQQAQINLNFHQTEMGTLVDIISMLSHIISMLYHTIRPILQ